MQAVVYAKTTNGLPTSTVVADLSDRTDEIEYVHSAFWGPLTARVSWGGSLEEGFTAADQWLGNPISIISPDGVVQWSGLIWSVRFSAGNRSRSRSLEGYANRAWVHYKLADFTTTPPTDLGPAGSSVSDTAEQAIYGEIETHENGGAMTATTAANQAGRTLQDRRRLLWVPDSGGVNDPPRIEIEAMGWWRTLTYQAYVTQTTGLLEMKTVIQNILTAECPFISTDYSLMGTTSILVQRQYDKYEYPSDIIKRLVATAAGYVFGITNDRIPYLQVGQRFALTPTYYEQADGTITTAAGATVNPWEVRPDAILRQVDFVPPSANLTAAIDAVESLYVAETTYNSRDNSVSYKPAVARVLGKVDA